jgi:hypothetical protein
MVVGVGMASVADVDGTDATTDMLRERAIFF